MASQRNLDRAYMACAEAIALLSCAQRKKVGAILVSANGNHIIAEGFNGTPSGFDNICEEEARLEDTNRMDVYHIPNLVTKTEVVHAESNCILKCAKSTNSSEGATLYCTLSPCFDCAKQIIQAGIKRVVYKENYPYAGHSGPVRLMGLELLAKAKIEVIQLC